jgi:hypothetical protein
MVLLVGLAVMTFAVEADADVSLTHSNAQLSVARANGGTATSVGDQAFIAGGVLGGYHATVDIYDGSTGTWSATNMSQARGGLASTGVGNFALFGGGFSTAGKSDVVDIYDTSASTWTTAALSEAREYPAATTVGNLAMFAGGYSASGYSDVVDIYNASTDTWSTATLSVARRHLTATTVGDLAMFAGGQGAAGYTNIVDIYNVSTDSWSTANLSQARMKLGSTTVGNLAMFGGGYAGSDRAEVDIYDASTDTWSTSTLPSGPRRGIGATTAGGVAIFGHGYVWTKLVDVYDPSQPAGSEWSTFEFEAARNWHDGPMTTSVGNQALFAGDSQYQPVENQRVDIYTVIPEPATMSMLALGGLAVLRRRRRKA